MAEPVFILAGVRTAIGTFGGGFLSKEPTELGGLVAAEAMRRAAVSPDQIGHVVFGNVIPTAPKTPIWRALLR